MTTQIRDYFNDFYRVYLIFYNKTKELNNLNDYLNNSSINKDINDIIKLTIKIKPKINKKLRNVPKNHVIIESYNKFLNSILKLNRIEEYY